MRDFPSSSASSSPPLRPLEANRKLKDIWSIDAHLAIEDKYSEMFKYTLSGKAGGLMLDLSEKMKKNLYILFFASEVVCSFPLDPSKSDDWWLDQLQPDHF